MEPTSLLTESEAAALLIAKTQTLRAWRYRNRGPAFLKLAGKVRYRLTDVEAFIERSRVDPDAKQGRAIRRRRAA